MYEIKNVTKAFHHRRESRRVLKDVCLTIGPGESVAIMGGSGAGKSTFLRILAGTCRADGGALVADDQVYDLSAKRTHKQLNTTRVGFVPQDNHLVSDLSVKDNILLPYRLYPRTSKKQAVSRVQDLAQALAIDGILTLRGGRVSGGEAQRALVAQALLLEPPLVVADEPTGALDAVNSGKVADVFESYFSTGGRLIVATHDDELAQKCDRVYSLTYGCLE